MIAYSKQLHFYAVVKVDTNRIICRELRPEDWPRISRLFGEKGACGGCWCMHWRVEKGGKSWEAVKGEPNRKAFQKLVNSGRVRGILAFDNDSAVGWCSFGEREEFPRVERMKAYARDSESETKRLWAINCFYLAKGYREKGISHLLAKTAVDAIRNRGGKRIEAYPVTLTKDGNKLPAAFSFTGSETIFRRLGFREIQRLSRSRPLYQLNIK